jgi:hypothetical protein
MSYEHAYIPVDPILENGDNPTSTNRPPKINPFRIDAKQSCRATEDLV